MLRNWWARPTGHITNIAASWWSPSYRYVLPSIFSLHMWSHMWSRITWKIVHRQLRLLVWEIKPFRYFIVGSSYEFGWTWSFLVIKLDIMLWEIRWSINPSNSNKMIRFGVGTRLCINKPCCLLCYMWYVLCICLQFIFLCKLNGGRTVVPLHALSSFFIPCGFCQTLLSHFYSKVWCVHLKSKTMFFFQISRRHRHQNRIFHVSMYYVEWTAQLIIPFV